MLRMAAEKTQPMAIVSAVDQDDEKPVSGGDKERGQGGVAEEGKSRPVPVLAAQLGVTFGQDKLIPFVVHLSRRALGIELQKIPGMQRIPREQSSPKSPILECKLGGENDLAVVVTMDRDLVVFDVAGTKPDMVPPAEKCEYPQKELIQRLRLEGCTVHEFMTGGAPDKVTECAVSEQ